MKKHAFEEAGLGKAPFRFVGVEERRGPIKMPDGSEVGAHGQPMGTCEFCFQGIAICCHVRSADGKQFVVGSDCVLKTGDKGLKKNVDRFKARKRREAADRRAKKDEAIIDRALEEHGDELAALPHSIEHYAADGKTLKDWLEYMRRACGNAGLRRTARWVLNRWPELEG